MATVETPSSDADTRNRSIAIVAFCFLLSGFAALLYETVWVRQFAIILGTSEQALAVVLASYMGGLALGSAIAARYVDRIRRPLLTYGVLEAGIAAAALAMPIGLMIVRVLQSALFGGADEPPDAGSLSQILFCFASAFALILLPTTMMGATLPLLAKHVVHRDEELGPRIAWLYAINTAGAVAGTLVAAFVCLPALGLSRTVWVGVVANLVVFALIWRLAKGLPQPKVGQVLSGRHAGDDRYRSPGQVRADGVAKGTGDSRHYQWIVWLAAFSGAVSFCYEIIFTRMLGHIVGGSIFAFATMLSGFLLGITIGSAIATRFARTRSMAATGFAYAQCLAAITAVIAYHALNAMAGWPLKERFGDSTLLMYVTVSIAALLPTAICIGATFPLAIRVCAASENDAAEASARVYLWNVLGAIAGALLTGAYLLPVLEYEGAARIAVFGNLALAIAAIALFRLPRAHFGVVAIGFATVIGFLPNFPENVLRRSAIAGDFVEGELIHSDVGPSGTVALFRQPLGIQLRTNGLPEARVSPRGSMLTMRGSAVWLSALPPLLRPKIESMLIVGLGGGVAASSVPPSVEQIDVFELEPAVVEANRLISTERVSDPMLDTRVTVILNDGRSGLHLTSKMYDAIVSQPSHPWTAGASHLFTREFAETAKEHLTDRGILLQWMSAEFVDIALLKSMTASLLEVFSHVRLYSPTHDQLLFVAAMQAIDPEKTETAIGFIPRINRDYYQQLGIRSPTDLFGLLRFDSRGAKEFAGGAKAITDDRNRFATQLPRDATPESLTEIATVLASMRPLFREDFDPTLLCPTLNPAELLHYRNWDYGSAETERLIAMIADPIQRALTRADVAKQRGEWQQYGEILVAACQTHPEDPRAAFLLLADHFVNPNVEISIDEMEKLGGLLDDRHTRLIEAVAASVRGHWSVVKERDELLASVRRNEVSFPYVSNLRVMWRLASEEPDRRIRAREAIKIVDQSSLRDNDLSLSRQRIMAGTVGKRPQVALATAQYGVGRINGNLVSGGTVSLGTLKGYEEFVAECLAEIDDPIDFTNVSEADYKYVVELANDVLFEIRQKIRAAEAAAETPVTR